MKKLFLSALVPLFAMQLVAANSEDFFARFAQPCTDQKLEIAKQAAEYVLASQKDKFNQQLLTYGKGGAFLGVLAAGVHIWMSSFKSPENEFPMPVRHVTNSYTLLEEVLKTGTPSEFQEISDEPGMYLAQYIKQKEELFFTFNHTLSVKGIMKNDTFEPQDIIGYKRSFVFTGRSIFGALGAMIGGCGIGALVGYADGYRTLVDAQRIFDRANVNYILCKKIYQN